MSRRVVYYLLSAGSVYLTMSYMMTAFIAIFASFGLTVI
jgi:hypothetical protein